MGPDDLQGWAFLIAVFTVFVLLVSLIIRYVVRSIIRARREARRPRCDCGTTVVHYAPGGKRELGRTVTYDRDCAKCGGTGLLGLSKEDFAQRSRSYKSYDPAAAFFLGEDEASYTGGQSTCSSAVGSHIFSYARTDRFGVGGCSLD